MSQPIYPHIPRRKKPRKSKVILFLLILGLIVSSTLLIPSPASTLYYYSGHVKSVLNTDGTSTIFYPNGQVFYQGELANGLAHGFGTQYDDTGVILYEGIWTNGVITGYGKDFYPSGSVRYTGDWKNGQYHGQGVKLYENQQEYYSGDWIYGIPSGTGEFYDENGVIVYQGNLVNGNRHGRGKEFIDGKLHYDGLWYEGDYYGDYSGFYLPDGTNLPPSLGHYYLEVFETQGHARAVSIISELIPHIDVIESATDDTYLKYLLYQHLEMPRNYNPHTIRAIIKEFESVPISIFEDLVALGVTHRLITGSIANQPEFSNIRESSRGISLAEAVGLSSPVHKLLITRLDRGTPPGTAMHELGHGVDYFLLDNISKTDDFEILRKTEARDMFLNRFLDNQYFIDYTEEYFAEFFAQYYLSEDSRMFGGPRTMEQIKGRAPKTAEFFLVHIDGYKSKYNFKNVYELPQLAAQTNIPINFSIKDITPEAIELKIDMQNPIGNKLYILPASSNIQQLSSEFKFEQDDIISLILNEQNRVFNTDNLYELTSEYILYLIIDEDNNFTFGSTETLSPRARYFQQREATPLEIEESQPIIFFIWGKLRNLITI